MNRHEFRNQVFGFYFLNLIFLGNPVDGPPIRYVTANVFLTQIPTANALSEFESFGPCTEYRVFSFSASVSGTKNIV